MTDAAWQLTYGVNAEDAALVAQGRSDGTFSPAESITRGQFTKMATSGLYIPSSAPENPTFSDVRQSHIFFSHVEGCTAAGVISGYSDGSFRPNACVTRQQACSVIGHWLAQQEIAANGGIVSARGSYASLKAWYTAEGSAVLAPFADTHAISPAHKATAAYLVWRGVVVGSSSEEPAHLRPTIPLNRAQSVALILRARQTAVQITQPAVTSIEPATGLPPGGDVVTVRGRGFLEVTEVWFGETPATGFSVDSATTITAVAPAHEVGPVDVRVVTATETSSLSTAALYTYSWDGATSIVLTEGQTPLRGVWNGTAERLASYLQEVRPSPLFTVPTLQLAGYYVRYSAEAGLRADLLWAQMIHETGYGMYGGDVLPEQNNYAGIGATGGGVPGISFISAEAGVMAHVAHMVAYVYTESPVSWANATTDPRFECVNPRGIASVLSDLNGRWAVPGTTYGQSIETIARAINSD